VRWSRSNLYTTVLARTWGKKMKKKYALYCLFTWMQRTEEKADTLWRDAFITFGRLS